MDTNRETKYYECWLEHKGKKGWKKQWTSIRGKNLWFFLTKNTQDQSQFVGSLPLDKDTHFDMCKPGAKGPYKFQIFTTHNDNFTRKNEFKCEDKKTLLEMKGFVESICQGHVTDDAKGSLLPGQILLIEKALTNLTQVKSENLKTFASHASSGSASSEGSSTANRHSTVGLDSARISTAVQGSMRLPQQIQQKHFFFNETSKNSITPHWFFGVCSRTEAEEVLLSGFQYGNVLMRECSTHQQDGSYVISMRQDNKLEGPHFYHYKVTQGVEGYQIDMEEIEQTPMKCLHDVMNHFLSTAITKHHGYKLKKMTTNNRLLLGNHDHTYDTQRPGLDQGRQHERPESGFYQEEDNASKYGQDYMNVDLGDFFPPQKPVELIEPSRNSDDEDDDIHDYEEQCDILPGQNAKSIFVAHSSGSSLTEDIPDADYYNTPEHYRVDIPMPHEPAPPPPIAAVQGAMAVSPRMSVVPHSVPTRSPLHPPPNPPVPPPLDNIPSRRFEHIDLNATVPAKPKGPKVLPKPPLDQSELQKKIEASKERRQSNPAFHSFISEEQGPSNGNNQTDSKAARQRNQRSRSESFQTFQTFLPSNTQSSKNRHCSDTNQTPDSINEDSTTSSQSELDRRLQEKFIYSTPEAFKDAPVRCPPVTPGGFKSATVGCPTSTKGLTPSFVRCPTTPQIDTPPPIRSLRDAVQSQNNST